MKTARLGDSNKVPVGSLDDGELFLVDDRLCMRYNNQYYSGKDFVSFVFLDSGKTDSISIDAKVVPCDSDPIKYWSIK